MTVWNLGSINIDDVFRVPHLPQPGETLAATGSQTNLGGKGANQSAAAALFGADVRHVGAVGPDGDAVLEELRSYGVDVAQVARLGVPTGRALITVDAAGENMIVLYPGANVALESHVVAAAMAEAEAGDILLLQNETLHQPLAARLARAAGLRVFYSAAPFDAAAVRAVLPHVSVLLCNEIEAGQLAEAMGCAVTDLPVPALVVTRGARGVEWHEPGQDGVLRVPGRKVEVVDTTGAGDCLAGTLAAALDQGLRLDAALRAANAAATLACTKPGAAASYATAEEVRAFAGSA